MTNTITIHVVDHMTNTTIIYVVDWMVFQGLCLH
jgi:hypothetical protein